MLGGGFAGEEIFAGGFEFLLVVFNVMEKRGPVFLSLVFASFIKTLLGKLSGFSTYVIF